MSVLPGLETVVSKMAPDRLLHSRLRRWRTVIGVALQDLKRHDPILVYQMGKVGSTTVYESLRQAGLPNPIFHIHYLAPENIRRCKERYRQRGMLDAPRALHLSVGRVLSWRIRLAQDVRWIVVTGVRDPIRRTISEIFQVIDWKYPALCRNGHVEADRVLDYLNRALRPSSPLIQRTYTWIDREVKSSFGVDLYEHSFDKNRGYQIVRGEGIKLLVYRLENLDRALIEGMARLLSLDRRIEAATANRSSEKKNRRAYDEVLDQFTIDEALCRRIYDHRLMDHFYGAAMVEALVHRWTT